MASIWDFLDYERGQDRTRALNEFLGSNFDYYLGPTGIPGKVRSLNTLLNPIDEAMQAGADTVVAMDSNRSAEERKQAAINALIGTVSAAAPTIVAGRAGMPAVNAIAETLTGAGGGMRNTADEFADAARRFQLEEAGSFPAPAAGLLADAPVKPSVAELRRQANIERFGYDPNSGITAYHGSPHRFDKFSMDAIGTGEGAQAYGHGLYFTETEDVARGYRDALSSGMDAKVGDQSVMDIYNRLESQAERVPSAKAGPIYERMAFLEDLELTSDLDLALSRIDDPATEAWARAEIAPKFTPAGSMYEVNINADPADFLDYDAPLSGQPAWQKIRNRWDETLGDPDIIQERLGLDPETAKGASYMYKLGAGLPGNDVGISNRLREAGIPGIKYFDAGSRGAGEGSRNFVVFDENLINIVKKYGIAGAAAMLGASVMDVEQAMAQGAQQQPQGLLSMGAQ
jgi:hypothetical protein